jgi:hypothetical protein
MFFYLAVCFRREQREALQFVAFVELVFASMMKSVAENDMDPEF